MQRVPLKVRCKSNYREFVVITVLANVIVEVKVVVGCGSSCHGKQCEPVLNGIIQYWVLVEQ